MYIQKLNLLSTETSPADLTLALICTTGSSEVASSQSCFQASRAQMQWQN